MRPGSQPPISDLQKKIKELIVNAEKSVDYFLHTTAGPPAGEARDGYAKRQKEQKSVNCEHGLQGIFNLRSLPYSRLSTHSLADVTRPTFKKSVR